MDSNSSSRAGSILRWFLVLPCALLGFILVLFPLHWVLQATTYEGGTVQISIETANRIERILTPLVASFGFVSGGTAAAPRRRLSVAIFLSLLLIVSAQIIIRVVPQLSAFWSKYPDTVGRAMIFQLAGVLAGIGVAVLEKERRQLVQISAESQTSHMRKKYRPSRAAQKQIDQALKDLDAMLNASKTKTARMEGESSAIAADRLCGVSPESPKPDQCLAIPEADEDDVIRHQAPTLNPQSPQSPLNHADVGVTLDRKPTVPRSKFHPKKRYAILFLALIIFAAWLRPWPASYWQNNGLFGGYDDYRVNNKLFRVTFEGNVLTDAQTVEDCALLRASEVAWNAGEGAFVICERRTWRTALGRPKASFLIEPISYGWQAKGRLVYECGIVRENLRAQHKHLQWWKEWR